MATRSGAGGANIALAQFAGGKAKNNKKPSAGITGAKAGGKTIQVVGYGCGDDTAGDDPQGDAPADAAARRPT